MFYLLWNVSSDATGLPCCHFPWRLPRTGMPFNAHSHRESKLRIPNIPEDSMLSMCVLSNCFPGNKRSVVGGREELELFGEDWTR